MCKQCELQWVANCHDKSHIIEKCAKICSKHFKYSDYKKKNLSYELLGLLIPLRELNEDSVSLALQSNIQVTDNNLKGN